MLSSAHNLARALPCCYWVLIAPKTPVPLPPVTDLRLPAHLRRARTALRLSKRAMAARPGVPEATYLLWEPWAGSRKSRRPRAA